jgi:hypothetical protein
MIAEHDAMPHDAIILAQVMEERGLNVKALAARAGCDEGTLYKYLAGQRTCPSIIFRHAFECTLDSRLLRLIAGAVPICIHALGQIAPADSPTPTATEVRKLPLPEALDLVLIAIEKCATSGRFMHQIARDGRFDRADLSTADQFERDAGAAQMSLTTAIAAIHAYREQLAQEQQRKEARR